MRISLSTSCITSLLLVSLMPRAEAAFSNYNSVLIGSRAAGMGGAFAALTDDVAATPFYNPATSVLMTGNSLSATVNVYNKYSTDLGDSGNFAEAPQKLNQGYFRSLPSASGTLLHFKSFAFGLSILVPDYDFYSGPIRGSQTTNSLLNVIDESLWIGGTFSTKLTEKDAVGFTVYYTARNLSRTVNDREATGGGTGATVMNEMKNITANSIVPIFGYHRRLSPTWAIGLSYRAPSLPIAGEGTYYKETIVTAPYSSTVINRGSLRAITKIPAKATLGFAREIKNQNTLSFDLQMYEALSYNDLPEIQEGSDQVNHHQLVNFAVGFEQFVRSWLTFRFGVYSNLSSHPEPSLRYNARQGDHVDMSGFSANFRIETPEHTTFTFGGYYSQGQGQTTQIVGNRLTLVPKSQQIFTMLIATGFMF